MRKTFCDACRTVKPDCLWTERVKSGMRYVLCAACRGYWERCGHELRNVEPDALTELDVMAGDHP